MKRIVEILKERYGNTITNDEKSLLQLSHRILLPGFLIGAGISFMVDRAWTVSSLLLGGVFGAIIAGVAFYLWATREL